jgi:hypothetical protein
VSRGAKKLWSGVTAIVISRSKPIASLAGAQATLHESIEALRFVPDLDDAEAEIGGSGQMEVDTSFRVAAEQCPNDGGRRRPTK